MFESRSQVFLFFLFFFKKNIFFFLLSSSFGRCCYCCCFCCRACRSELLESLNEKKLCLSIFILQKKIKEKRERERE
ncbi:hypothetical protein J3Q64DRAFT_1719993 [Phycomyces blakesleeanus]|uniref:Secreted protein n=1 Tax=Phycomyces blakesleeanus TaxID=4837 RepID=A0ABR3BAR1_PHYBL